MSNQQDQQNQQGRPIKIFLPVLIASLIFLFSPGVVFAANLLNNPGFESGVDPWDTYGATISQSEEHKKSDSFSGKVQTTTTNSGLKYIYQVVTIQQDKFYKASGFVMKQGETRSKVFLRVAFYSSADGSGSQISTFTSNEITQNGTEFQLLELNNFQAPANALSARLRPSLEMPGGADQQGIAYFDDLLFEETSEPQPSPTPTPTPVPTVKLIPTPTPKPTSTPTSKPTPTPTPTQTKTPTPKPTISPLSTGKILATGVSLVLGENETGSPSFLATETGNLIATPEASPSLPEATVSGWQNFLPKILLVLAGIAILALAVSLFLIQKRQRNKIMP